MANNLDAPPSYEDVIEEEDLARKTEKLRDYSQNFFKALNLLFSSLIICGLLIIRHSGIIHVHMSNVTIYCNDPNFNVSPIPKSENSYIVFVVFLVSAVITTVGTIRYKMDKLTFDILARNIVLELWAFTNHLFFLFFAIELIKLATGMPSPYFFENKDLKNYYCEPHGNTTTLSRELQLLDESYRISFPSYRAAIFAFCITYLYLYIDHHDILIGMHTIQHLVLIVLGAHTSHLMVGYVENKENHEADVVFAIIIGFLQALAAIRNTFGTIVYRRTHISSVSIKKFYNTNITAASNLFELQPLRQNLNNAPLSTNNPPSNSSRTPTNTRTPPNTGTNSEDYMPFLMNIPQSANMNLQPSAPNIPLNE